MITQRSRLKEVMKDPCGRHFVVDVFTRMGMREQFADNPIVRRTRIGLLPKLTGGAVSERDIAELIRHLNRRPNGEDIEKQG